MLLFTACDGAADIVFMLDTSGSIRRTRFEMLKEFLMSILKETEIGLDRARIALLTFSDNATGLFNLNTYTKKEDILQVHLEIPG